MKQLLVPIAIIVGLIAFLSLSTARGGQNQPVAETISEAKTERTIKLEDKTAPSAVPVVTPEEAEKANLDAINFIDLA